MTGRVEIVPGLYRSICDSLNLKDPRHENLYNNWIPEFEIGKTDVYVINGDMVMRSDHFSATQGNKGFFYLLYPFFRDGRVKMVAEGAFAPLVHEQAGPSFNLLSEKDIQDLIRENLDREIHPLAVKFINQLPGENVHPSDE
jgi:hypothetical protein